MWPVKCSTKKLSKPLKASFAAVKTGLQKYHHTSFSGIGVNQIWILKISKDSLEALSTSSQYVCSNMNIFDLSTLYTAIPHIQLKYRIKEVIQCCFLKKNREQRYDYLVASWKAIQSLIIQDEIIQMLDFFYRQHIFPVWWMSVSTENWYSTGC